MVSTFPSTTDFDRSVLSFFLLNCLFLCVAYEREILTVVGVVLTFLPDSSSILSVVLENFCLRNTMHRVILNLGPLLSGRQLMSLSVGLPLFGLPLAAQQYLPQIRPLSQQTALELASTFLGD